MSITEGDKKIVCGFIAYFIGILVKHDREDRMNIMDEGLDAIREDLMEHLGKIEIIEEKLAK